MKFLPVTFVVVAMVSVVAYIALFRDRETPPVKQEVTEVVPLQPVELPAAPPSQQVPVPKPTTAPPPAGSQGALSSLSAMEARIKTLETAVSNLQSQVNQTQTTQTTTTTTTKKAPVYIPLGSGGQWNDQNWLALSSYEVSVDPAEYEGYTNMQLEVNMRLVQAAGKAYARLYNVTDGNEIVSEVSTELDKAVLLTSTTFKLPTGRKTYRLQVKSTYGFNIELQTARIKVSF